MGRLTLLRLWVAVAVLPAMALADEMKLGDSVTAEIQTRTEFDLLVNLETDADRHWSARPGDVRDPGAREIVEEALEDQADRLVDWIDAALVEARRLDQASQLRDRETIQDQLNHA